MIYRMESCARARELLRRWMCCQTDISKLWRVRRKALGKALIMMPSRRAGRYSRGEVIHHQSKGLAV